MDLGLTGKKVVITGGSRGIGRAIATKMLEEGASVAICARGQEGVDEAHAALQSSSKVFVHLELVPVIAFPDGIFAKKFRLPIHVIPLSRYDAFLADGVVAEMTHTDWDALLLRLLRVAFAAPPFPAKKLIHR